MPPKRKRTSSVNSEKTSPKTNQKIEDVVSDLQRVIETCQVVVDNLENNPGWHRVVEDFEAQRDRLDNTWQNVTDEKTWMEFRVTKLAVNKVLNIIEDYKADKKRAFEEMFKIQNPDVVTHIDVDNQ